MPSNSTCDLRSVADATAVTVLGVTNPPALVPAGVWQSAVPAGQEPVLVSRVVAPGFDFAHFTLE